MAVEVMPIAVVNEAKSPLGVDLGDLLRACQKQADEHFAPHWNKTARLILAASVDDADYAAIVILDDSDQANALGYHTTTPKGNPLGRVFVRTSGRGFTITFSHELLEMLGDPDATQTATDPKTGIVYALEVGDPTQGDSYLVDGIPLSNFATPHWFDRASAPGIKLDHLGLIPRPFMIRRGGYMPVRVRGKWTQIFGSDEARAAYHRTQHDRSPRRKELTVAENQNVLAPHQFAAMEPSLKAQAMAFGLPWDKFRGIVEKYGSDFLQVGRTLMASGLSAATIVEMITVLGPDVVRIVADWSTLGRQTAMAAGEGQDLDLAALGVGIPASLGGALAPFIWQKFVLPALQQILQEAIAHPEQFLPKLVELLKGLGSGQATGGLSMTDPPVLGHVQP